MKYFFYIYYKVPEEDWSSLYEKLSSIQESIAKKTGASVKLIRKLNEPFVWMEVYENVADHQSFSILLDEELAAANLSHFFEFNPRNVEIFFN